MNTFLSRLKSLKDDEARYAYADAATNALLTAQMKALRDERGLTQEQLAELVGTKQSGISRWQHSGYSNCKVETLRKFARAFHVRLRITFESFGSLPEDLGDFTKERLAPPKFEDDPMFNPPLETVGSGSVGASTDGNIGLLQVDDSRTAQSGGSAAEMRIPPGASCGFSEQRYQWDLSNAG